MKFRGIFKSIFVVLLILINCLFLMQPNVSASVNSAENNNVAINDNYSNDSILIMLNNESSLKFKEYDINDFIDIYFGSITEITTGTTKIVKRQLQDNKEQEVKININNFVEYF